MALNQQGGEAARHRLLPLHPHHPATATCAPVQAAVHSVEEGVLYLLEAHLPSQLPHLLLMLREDGGVL